MRPPRVQPGPGQESVWDYPRPPRLERSEKVIEVRFNGMVVARTNRAWRVLETSHPPVYYIPPEDIAAGCLMPAAGGSFCEWKGLARYFSLQVGNRMAERVAWSYPDPMAPFGAIRDHIAFYAAPMDGCFVDGERVTPQPGGFYGGWITGDVVGPFKGGTGSAGW